MPDFGYGNPMTVEQLEHYRKVKQKRKEEGVPVLTEQARWDHRADDDGVLRDSFKKPEQIEGNEHPLLKMRLRDTESGSTYVVDSVSNCWHDGFYIQMAIREEGTKSHALIFWENISSESEFIIEGVEEAQNRYKVIETSYG